jgi:myo-inositol 2-dehydrogenase/D-chiro-inositol 1-dehydrogenase
MRNTSDNRSVCCERALAGTRALAQSRSANGKTSDWLPKGRQYFRDCGDFAQRVGKAEAVLNTIVQVGLIGAGRIGQVHASTIVHRVARAQLVVVADLVPGAAEALAAKFHVPNATADYGAIIADPKLEAVLICTPTDTHAEIIIAASRAGKHIFCEKPIALNLKDADAALQAVNQAGVKFQVGFNRRFDANYARVRKAVTSGEIGKPQLLHITSRDPGPPPIPYIQTTGGIFLDMAIHDWDMARFLIGSEIEELYVQGGVMVDPAIGEAGDIDTHVTLVRFANGVVGTIENSRRAVYGYDQRVEILGSRGAVHTEHNYPNNTILSTAEAIQRDLPLNFFLQRYADAFAAEIEAFVEAVLTGSPVAVSGHDGRMALIVGLAAKKSYLERRPIRISEID